MFWIRVGIATVELNLRRRCEMLCKKPRKARYIYNPINIELCLLVLHILFLCDSYVIGLFLQLIKYNVVWHLSCL